MKRENRWESCSRQTNREEVMEDIKTLIDQINEEQKELVLKSFTNEEACALGIEMYQDRKSVV